jgi:hypothetical protein
MRLLIVLLAIIALVAASSLPAAAQNYQTTLQIRYWGTGEGAGAGMITATDAGSAWGGTLRIDSRSRPWSFSGRYDSISVTAVNFAFTGFGLWDVNAHYRFGPSLNSYVGVFVGYGGISTQSASPGSVGSTSGFRLGAEAFQRMQGGMYVTGDVAYGPSWSSNFAGFPGMAAGNIFDGRAAIGYEFQGGWGIEAGWRYYTWTIPSSNGCPTGCNFQFSGVTAALTFRR